MYVRMCVYIFIVWLYIIAAPMVKFLKEHLEKAGCGIGGNFIKAVNCVRKISGGYARGEGVTSIFNLYFQDLILDFWVNCSLFLNNHSSFSFQYLSSYYGDHDLCCPLRTSILNK